MIDIRVTVPNLRNGAVAEITQAAPRASIPVAFKWAHIGGLTHDKYATHVEDVIRAQYAQLLSEAGATASDTDKANARLKAIVLGAVRAAAAASFQLTPQDFNQAEVVGTGSSYYPATDGAPAVPGDPNAVPPVPDQPAQPALPAGVRTTAGTASPKHGVATSMAALNATEVTVVNTLMYIGFSVPAMQGVSLTLSGHHFLPTTKNVFAGMKRQAMQAGGTEVTNWVDARADDFDDWAFHKSCHPILPPLKRAWAKSSETGARLVASGHGAAAIRIPALPSDAQAGKAGIAVMMKASPVIRGMGHHVTWADGAERILAAEKASEGAAERAAVDAIRAWFTANVDNVAFCAGIVRHLSEALGTTQESTLRAFSVRKAMSDGSASVNRGVTYCRAYMAKVRDEAERGEFADPNITA